MEGYHKLATLMGSQPKLAIFRRFRSANASNLLYMQAELMWLQLDLAEAVKEDSLPNDPTIAELATSFARFRASADGPYALQYRRFVKLQSKLREYNSALLEFSQICKLAPAHKGDLHNLRTWIERSRDGKNFPDGIEGNVWDPDHEDDLTSLDRTPNEEDLFTNWFEGPFMNMIHAHFGDKLKTELEIKNQFFDTSMKTNFKEYSGPAVLTTINAANALIATIVPVLSIFLLSSLRSSAARSVVITVLMIVFTLCVGVFARAKKFEYFMLSAAFAAVLAVFVNGNNASAQCPA